MAKTFKYGGYTFEPRGKFKDFGVKDDFKSISVRLNSCNFGYVADGDEPFDHDGFYQAAGDVEDDVFFCVENGVLYVPCAKSLQIFTPTAHEASSVTKAYQQRRIEREEREQFRKREALKEAMIFTEEQHQAYIKLCKVINECTDLGMQFAYDGDNVHVFRADLLKDLTTNMVPMEGQETIDENSFCQCIYGAWDIREGLYANVKED